MRQNNSWIDGTLYPDQDAPDDLGNLSVKVEFLARLCAAWDYGILPDTPIESTTI